MAIKHVDPISRIEGHLGVRVHETGGYATDVEVHGNLWRGFENFLLGRQPNDAITFTQRICGVCPVPHGTASTFAVDAVYGYNDNFQTFSTLTAPAGKGIPPKAVLIRNLVLAAEFLMSHITHFYHLAAPSYVQGPNMPPWTPYYDDSFYHTLLVSTGKGLQVITNANQPGQAGSTLPADDEGFSVDLWSAVIKQYVKALRIRRLTFEAGALFAGRMPMTSSLVSGGTTYDKSENLTSRLTMFRDMMVEVGNFIIKEHVPVVLALGALYPNYDNLANATTLNTAYPALWTLGNKDINYAVPQAENTGWGGGCGNFLAWGAFPNTDGSLGLARGFMLKATALAGGSATSITSANVYANLREHVKHSRYDDSSAAALAAGYTGTGISDPAVVNRTIPKRNDPDPFGKYSWLKAPRWNGNPMEVGPFARMVVGGFYKVDGTPLANNAYYAMYTWADTGGTGLTGLDPRMVGADLAVALVRSGLAELKTSLDNGATVTTVTQANVNTLTKAQLLAGYTYYNAAGAAIKRAHIMGAARDWIVLLVGGLSTMDRLRARALEASITVQKLIGSYDKDTGAFPALVPAASASRPTNTSHPTWGWVQQLKWENDNGIADTFRSSSYDGVSRVSGFGATEAPRGALMHMCTIEKDRIIQYQCIVPTTWNASPKDASDVRGPMEEAIKGTAYNMTATPATGGAGGAVSAGGGVEALRVAQSFDPCIACAVH